jgi:Tfp pilus assembly protein FimV
MNASRRGLAALAASGVALLLSCSQIQAQLPRDANAATVRGKIDRFTTSRMGEVDGAVLDDGTWIRWPPRMQDRFQDVLKAGDSVRATGRMETGPAGDTHFEIRSVTNLRTNASIDNPDFANAPPAPAGAAARRQGDLEQRVRDLENQVDELRRELQRLQRERKSE